MPLDATRARLVARVGGGLYLLIIVLGALGEAVVRGSIVVPGNAGATAANLRSMEWLWRLGVAAESPPPDVRHCRRAHSLCPAPPRQPRSRADGRFLQSRLHRHRRRRRDLSRGSAVSGGFGIALIFFGVECVILGYLISRSGYMPKLIGVLMQIAVWLLVKGVRVQEWRAR